MDDKERIHLRNLLASTVFMVDHGDLFTSRQEDSIVKSLRDFIHQLDQPAPDAAPATACKHPIALLTTVEYWVNGKKIPISTCSCDAVRLGSPGNPSGEWYPPEQQDEPKSDTDSEINVSESLRCLKDSCDGGARRNEQLAKQLTKLAETVATNDECATIEVCALNKRIAALEGLAAKSLGLNKWLAEFDSQAPTEDSDIDTIAECQRIDGRVDELASGLDTACTELTELTEKVGKQSELVSENWKAHQQMLSALESHIDTKVESLHDRLRVVEGFMADSTGRSFADTVDSDFVQDDEPVACEHPLHRVLVRAMREGGVFEWCTLCGCIRHHSDKWMSPENAVSPPKPEIACEHPKPHNHDACCKMEEHNVGEHPVKLPTCPDDGAVWLDEKWYSPNAAPPTPKPACEHLNKDEVRIRGRVGIAVTVTRCKDCGGVLLSSEWFIPASQNAVSPSTPKPACEHPDPKQQGIYSIDRYVTVMACECGAKRLEGIWFTPEPAPVPPEKKDADAT